jgi:transcriptional regulator with XRE-family HTH domain
VGGSLISECARMRVPTGRLRIVSAPQQGEAADTHEGPPSPGRYIRDQRQRRGMSVEQLAIDTKIPRASIDALEEDHFSALPGPVFVKGFFRCCARSLGIDAEVVLSLLHDRERALQQLKVGGRRERQSPQSPQLIGRSSAASAAATGYGARGQDTPPRSAGVRGPSAAMHAVPGEAQATAVTPQPSLFRFDSLTPLLSRLMSASNSRLLMWIAVALMVGVIVVTAFIMAGGRGPGLPNS